MFTLICLILGLAWALKPARGAGEILVGLLPVAMFEFSSTAGGVASRLAGDLVGFGVALGGELVALLVLVAIGNRFRARRMSEAIRAA